MLHIHFQSVMLRCTQGNKRKKKKNSEETFPFIVSLRLHSPLPPSSASLCALLHCGRSLTEQTAAGYTVWEDGAISREVGGASPAEGRNTSWQPTVSCDEATQSCISSSLKDFWGREFHTHDCCFECQWLWTKPLVTGCQYSCITIHLIHWDSSNTLGIYNWEINLLKWEFGWLTQRAE